MRALLFYPTLVFSLGVILPALALDNEERYVTVQGGISHPDTQAFTNASGARVTTKLEDGYVVVGAIGRGFNNGLRAEIEGGYRQSKVDGHTITGPTLGGSDGEVKVLTGMVNGYYDIPTSATWQPYVGLGVGVASLQFDDYSATATGQMLDQTETVPAVQGMAGINAPITSRVSLNAEYRYFTTAKATVQSGNAESNAAFATHNVVMGARYAF